MSLQLRISSLITAIGTDYKIIIGKIGNLPSLTTTAKTDLVSAVNEVKASIPAGGAVINDVTPSGTTVYSSNKTNSAIATSVAALVNSAPAALDTLAELSTALGGDASFATTTAAALGNRVRVDTAAQGLTAPQQANARTNIAVYSQTELGDPETDLVALYTTAKL